MQGRAVLFQYSMGLAVLETFGKGSNEDDITAILQHARIFISAEQRTFSNEAFRVLKFND